MSKKLIVLQGIGINGKSHIVDRFLKSVPNSFHLPQGNREYFKTHPDEGLYPDQSKLMQFNMQLLKDFDYSKDGVYITERTVSSLFSFMLANNLELKMDEVKIKDLDGKEGLAIDITRSFDEWLFSQFDEVEINYIFNFDLKWLKSYFERLKISDPENVHRKFYKSRGFYITLQDRYFLNWVKINNRHYSIYEFYEFFKDSDILADILIDRCL